MSDQVITLSKKISPVTLDTVIKSKLLSDFKIKLAEHNIKITPATMMKSVGYAMEVVELSELKGEAQKTMAVSLIASLIDDVPLEKEDKNIMSSILNKDVVEDMIELIIQVTKGNININKLQEVATGCCLGFMKHI